MSIKPTVGRIVHVHLSGNDNVLAGIICAVHERGINVAGFDQNGNPYRANGVRLVRDGEDTPVMGTWAEWIRIVAPESPEPKSDVTDPVFLDGGDAPVSLT
jgi:hypothetical protein